MDVPVEEAWALWDDRSLIPTWMPWVDSVQVRLDLRLGSTARAGWGLLLLKRHAALLVPDADLSMAASLHWRTQIEDDDPKMSRWTLKTNQFGRDWTLSWLAQNLTPIPLQKIHWRSVPGSMSMQGIEVRPAPGTLYLPPIRSTLTGPACDVPLPPGGEPWLHPILQVRGTPQLYEPHVPLHLPRHGARLTLAPGLTGMPGAPLRAAT